ncbi:Two-component system YycF/YycG regulatory protein YycH [compost metagenome]
MIEKLKTLSLTVLIVASLLQSYLLAYSAPKYDPIPQNDYVQTEALGNQIELNDSLFPDQIIVHMGDRKHSVLYPNSYSYRTILDNVKKRTFAGLRKTTMYLANINWDDVREKSRGIEVRFRNGIPINVLQNVLQIKGEIPVENDFITKIWIFVSDNKEEVRTFFFTDTMSMGYEVVEADFTTKDVENYVLDYAEPSNLYRSVNGEYYLPLNTIRVTGYTFPYTQFTAEQLKRSLFVDPGITRNLKERDGSEIYTDGKRGLQINKELRWINYSDPVARIENKNDLKSNLLASVQFVNQHGGWDGIYRISKMPLRQSYSDQNFVFRMFYDSFPVMSSTTEGFGIIKLNVQKELVASYERSLIIPDVEKVVRNDGILPSAEEVETRLKGYSKKSSIVSMFAAYRPRINEKTIDLTPVWAIELRDGTFEFME